MSGSYSSDSDDDPYAYEYGSPPSRYETYYQHPEGTLVSEWNEGDLMTRRNTGAYYEPRPFFIDYDTPFRSRDPDLMPSRTRTRSTSPPPGRDLPREYREWALRNAINELTQELDQVLQQDEEYQVETRSSPRSPRQSRQ